MVVVSGAVCVCARARMHVRVTFFVWKERERKKTHRMITHILNMCVDKLLSVKGCNVVQLEKV